MREDGEHRGGKGGYILGCHGVGIDDPAVDADVFIDHAVDPEARHRMLPDAPPIEREHARKLVHHLVEGIDDEAGDAVVDDLAHGAAIEGGDRRAARHRLGQHEAERLARLIG